MDYCSQASSFASLFLAAAETALEEFADGDEDDDEAHDLEGQDDGRGPPDCHGSCRGGGGRGYEAA